MKRVGLVLGLCLLASPLMGQGLVGRWVTQTEAINTANGQPVILKAEIQFYADSTFDATLTSDDGSGEPGQTAVTKGEYRVITDPWGYPEICVRRADGRDRPHCQPFRVTEGKLEWGSLVFGPDRSTQPS